MKKIICLLLTAMVIIASSALCFAATDMPSGSEITPSYVTTGGGQAAFSINSSGIASLKGYFPPRVIGIVDKVDVNFLVKSSSGTTVVNSTVNCKWNTATKDYIGSYSGRLPGKGKYMLYTTFYCYREGKLLETVKVDAVVKSY